MNFIYDYEIFGIKFENYENLLKKIIIFGIKFYKTIHNCLTIIFFIISFIMNQNCLNFEPRKVSNLSDALFAREFAIVYKKFKLDILYGIPRRIAFTKFIREMQAKGYYQLKAPKLYTCDKYWSRLNPDNWSASRLSTWKVSDMIFFEKITKRKKKKKISTTNL